MADNQELKESLAKYTSKINDAALQGMAKTYALVMSNKDSRFVSCGDASEKDTVRENFLKKKLSLKNSDGDLNAAIDDVCSKMKDDRFKNRVVFYYLLAEKYNLLGNFSKLSTLIYLLKRRSRRLFVLTISIYETIYLPIQNLLKISPNKSSDVNSPVILPRASCPKRNSSINSACFIFCCANNKCALTCFKASKCRTRAIKTPSAFC